MKKPTMKNSIKYWTTTIAVSGMLVVGACGDSNETAENELETTETEVVAPVQEPVANIEDTTIESQEPDQSLEFERTSNTQSDMNAARMPDMDAHLEEHKEVNEKIRETLTSGTVQDQNEIIEE